MEDVNLINAIYNGYQEHFSNNPNIVGSSEIPFGMRKIVINKRNQLQLEFNNKLLAGKMFHYSLQKPGVMYFITKEINTALGYSEREINGKRYIELENGNFMGFEVESETASMTEIIPGYFFRMHQDIHTTLYTIEIKTTNLPRSLWKDLAIYHILQLNSYMGFNHQKFGFLLKIDLGSTKEDERYTPHGGFYNSSSTKFNFIWNKYFMLYPHEFNEALFDYTIKKLKSVFTCLKLETKEELIPCPEHIFECDDACKDYCPNPINKVKMEDTDICYNCKEPIEMGTWGVIRNNQMYHYTDTKGDPYEACVEACKEAWRVVEE